MGRDGKENNRRRGENAVAGREQGLRFVHFELSEAERFGLGPNEQVRLCDVTFVDGAAVCLHPLPVVGEVADLKARRMVNEAQMNRTIEANGMELDCP